jgi:hypothetical protein
LGCACGYFKKRRKRYNLTQGYADSAKRHLAGVLIPYSGKMPMNNITGAGWFLDCLIGKKYQNAAINSFYATFKTMMIEAAERNIITQDPRHC